MFTTRERIAMARIISDMIKADNIIEETEVEMLNALKLKYNLDSKVLSDARHIKFSTAVNDLADLTDDEKIGFFISIRDIACADGACVPKEAMILLALRYAFGIERQAPEMRNYCINHSRKVSLISCPTGDTTINNQYVIYIEGKFNDDVNRSIRENLELNVLTLRQLGFDFIYIPSLIEEFKRMNERYVKDVIGYMAPELSVETIDTVYSRLLKMDTVSFCNYVLADKLHVQEVKNSEPSLLINIGTSIVPYSSVSGQVECYTEFLCIPLEADFTAQVRDYIKAYKKLVSYYAMVNQMPHGEDSCRFKYFGFYKALFDFLVKAEPKVSDICLSTHSGSFRFPQCKELELVLSPQEAALYKLILHCKCNLKEGGLPTAYMPGREDKLQAEINGLYERIYFKRKACLPDPLAPVRSKIEKKMREQLSGLANLEDFIPKLKDGRYVVDARPEKICISSTGQLGDRVPLVDYRWPAL